MPPDLSPLDLQRLSRRDQTLVLLRIASTRVDGPARASDLAEVADAYAIPASTNYSRDLSNLRSAGLSIRNDSGWRLTPEGVEAVHRVAVNIEPGRSPAAVPAAELLGVEHPLVPPELAPPTVRASVLRLIEAHPWERNVMLITRFQRETPGDQIDHVTAVIRDEVSRHGLHLLIASERRADDRLALNVVAHMWASKYGIALIEDLVGEGLNANVMFEAGGMVTIGRRLAIFRDTSAPRIPTDLTDHIYDNVGFSDPAQVRSATQRWLENDLHFPSAPS